MMRQIRDIIIIILLLAGVSFAGEQIAGFEEKDLPVLNDELRRIENVIEEVEERVPAGSMMLWPTDTAPTGWVLCDGSAYDATLENKYQPLFDVIGNDFGGSDNSDFTVPDLRGRIPLGQDDMGGSSANRVTDTDADTIGGADGDETHTHTGSSGGGLGATYAMTVGGPNTVSPYTHTHAVTVAAGDSLQPFITLNYIIKL